MPAPRPTSPTPRTAPVSVALLAAACLALLLAAGVQGQPVRRLPAAGGAGRRRRALRRRAARRRACHGGGGRSGRRLPGGIHPGRTRSDPRCGPRTAGRPGRRRRPAGGARSVAVGGRRRPTAEPLGTQHRANPSCCAAVSALPMPVASGRGPGRPKAGTVSAHPSGQGSKPSANTRSAATTVSGTGADSVWNWPRSWRTSACTCTGPLPAAIQVAVHGGARAVATIAPSTR